MTNDTIRLKMPYIKQSQSQKEVTHNAGLDLLDFYLNPVIEDHTLNVPPVSPTEGKMWIVALSSTGDWSGQENNIAYFLHGNWNFFTPFEGQTVWMKQPKYHAIFVSSLWEYGIMRGNEIRIWGQKTLANRGSAVGDASGGTIIDIEARAAINQLLSICRTHGILAA
jgi:hypothetical protein